MPFESIIKFKSIRKPNNDVLLSCTRTVGPAKKDGTIPGVLSVRFSEELKKQMKCGDDVRFDVLIDQENRQAMLKVAEHGFKLSNPKTAIKASFICFTLPKSLEYIPDWVSAYELEITDVGDGFVIFNMPVFDLTK